MHIKDPGAYHLRNFSKKWYFIFLRYLEVIVDPDQSTDINFASTCTYRRSTTGVRYTFFFLRFGWDIKKTNMVF